MAGTRSTLKIQLFGSEGAMHNCVSRVDKEDLTVKRTIVDGDPCLILNDDYTPPSLLAPTVSTVLQPSSGAPPSLPTARPSPVANQAAARDTVTRPIGKESETEGDSDDEVMTDGKAES